LSEKFPIFTKFPFFAEKFRELIDTAKEGVLFIDEAYDLDPKGDFKGKPIVSELLVTKHFIKIICGNYL
jgi:hypothetical protein